MKKLLFALALISSTAQAQNFGTESRVLAYWQKPIGAESPTAAAAAIIHFENKNDKPQCRQIPGPSGPVC